MKKTVVINKPGLRKYDNPLHVQFHSETYDIVHAVDPTKLGMPDDVMPEWRGNIDTEISNNRDAQADANTALMLEKDEERDRLVLFIIASVRNALLLSDADMVAAAKRLSVMTRRYAGIQKESFDRETADILGFLADLKDAKYTADVTKLEAVNTEFRKIYKERRETEVEKTHLPPSGKVRPETDALYERVILVLQWNYVYGKAPVDPNVIAQVAEAMNKQTDRIETVYRQSLAQRKAAGDKKPKEPKTPKGPKEPKQPKDPKPTPDPKQPEQPKKPDEKPKDPKKPDDGNPDITLPEE